jgi:hypothetical protein
MMYPYEYSNIPELAEGYYAEDTLYYGLGKNSWMKILISAIAALLPISFFFSVPQRHLGMCLLAYLNIVIILLAVWRFLRKRTLAATVPVLTMPYLLLSWPAGTLLFAILYPNHAFYITLDGHNSFFDAGIRLQLCVTLFLAGYFPLMFFALKNERHVEPAKTARVKILGPIAAVSSIGLFLFTGVAYLGLLPEFTKYVAIGLYKYLNGLVFIVGSLFKSYLWTTKIIILGLLAMGILFFTVGNARGMAIYCVAFFVLGLFLFGKYNRKIKLIIALCLCLAFPAYVTISNTTRFLLGSAGFEEGFSYRLKTLGEWKSVTVEVSPVIFTFGRLFFTGGHSIISRTPEEMPYRLFKIAPFLREFLESFVPGRFLYRPYYRSPLVLLDYGFNILPGKTSTEVSMIGSLWLMGGWLPVFFGGAALGFIHWLVVKIIQRSWSQSEVKALVYFGALAPRVFWVANMDIITHFRSIIYNLALATIVYWVIKLLGTEQRQQDLMME